MRVTKRISRDGDDERGATAVIVTLSLIALLGMIVLTVDVGQLLYKRRAMVNASDAAALAAAQSCAGLADSDDPGAMANAFAVDNVSTAVGGITDIEGCDGPAFGHVSVEYGMEQGLFFAGVLGADGPAQVRTEATAGWGPTGSANPLPIVVYTGQEQGNCDIQEGTPPGTPCYMWYDNDLFNNSSFGFLNLCTATDPCQQGWGVGQNDNCPNVGASLREDWIQGNWSGGPNEVDPPFVYVCRVSGVSETNWSSLEGREIPGDPTGHVFGVEDNADLIFPVNDCTQQVLTDGTVGCSTTLSPEKYAIVGFIVLHLEDVLDSASEWGGTSLKSCDRRNFDVVTGTTYPLSTLGPSGQCPSGVTPSGVEGFQINGQSSNPNWVYDDTNKAFTWTGPPGRVRVAFDWWVDGECGRPPNNSSAVCLQVTTVEVRFGGQGICPECADFGLRGVQLCDLVIGSCPD